jgi:hypothetical protein
MDVFGYYMIAEILKFFLDDNENLRIIRTLELLEY